MANPRLTLSSVRQRRWRYLVLLVPALAWAQGTPVVASGVKVHLTVGQQKVLNVGLAMGLLCDDGTVVQAELRPVSQSENDVVLTGLKAGKTDCRAGTANVSRSKLIHITVTAKP